jgi:hypothetical protein
MHIDRIPNRNSPLAYLLRESYREDGKVKKRTLANITHWPAGKIQALRRLLRDEYVPHEPRADLKLMRSHGRMATNGFERQRTDTGAWRGVGTVARIHQHHTAAGPFFARRPPPRRPQSTHPTSRPGYDPLPATAIPRDET